MCDCLRHVKRDGQKDLQNASDRYVLKIQLRYSSKMMWVSTNAHLAFLKIQYEELKMNDTCSLEAPSKRRKLCSMGSGEVMHILSYKALDDKIEEFETVVQEMARLLYSLESEITDVRVCHPKCGEVCFVLTFITREAMTKFQGTIQICSEARLKDLITTGSDPQFSVSGCLMPAAHTLPSLLSYLKRNVVGDNHTEHDVKAVQREIEKWFPRRGEYSQYISYDSKDATKYTRNLVFGNAHMDVILMCWPAGSRSTIHDHDDSSCWVVVVEGSVHEVQYAQPRLDKKFLEAEKVNPATATGSCGNLKVTNTAFLRCGGVTSTYANNEIGLHRVENRTEKLACTLHVYAPPLKKMRIYNEDGKVKVFVATASTRESGDSLTNDPIFDVDAWNAMNISLGESGSYSLA